MTAVKKNLNAIKEAASYFQNEMAKYRKLTKEEECLILPAQAAAMMGISPQAIESRMKEGSLKTFTVLGRHWVSGREVESIMEDRIKKALSDGVDKDELEEKILTKMTVNAKIMMKKSKKTKLERKNVE